MKLIPLLALFCLAATAPDDIPVVAQATLGENACGPCAVVNALLRSKHPDVLGAVKGETPLEKAGELVRRFGELPSEAYPGEKAYEARRGITWKDLPACVGTLGLRVDGDYLDRGADEPLETHLRRVHARLRTSIDAGFPPIVALRSFAAAPAANGEHVWTGLSGHYVALIGVQEKLDEGEKGFRFTYADSATGRREVGYAHVDEARNFTAAKGDEKRWEWRSDRPFLLVTAPSLRLKTQAQPWHLRTTIILNHAVTAR